LGIAVLLVAALFMLWLAKKKRGLAAITGGYLSLIAWAGLLSNAIWHISWADPAAALACSPLL
jgi:hypothetical protein